MDDKPKSAVHSLFATNKNLEVSGVWLTYPNFRIKIARAGGANKRYLQRLDEERRKHRRAVATDTMPAELQRELMVKVYSESIVLDWEGITNAEGKELTFSPQACYNLLMELPDLFLEIRDQAEELEMWRAAARELEAGNSLSA